MTVLTFAKATWTILRKDLQIEVATREIVVTSGFFAVLVVVMASVAFATGPQTATRVAPGALWLAIVFASILALGRTWQREREGSALVGLLLSPVPRAAIFLGKTLGVLLFLFAVELLIVPVVAVLFRVELLRVLEPLALVLVVGTLGVAGMGTLFGAMTVRTRARDLLLASVLFPLLSPVLLSCVAASRDLFYAAGAVGSASVDDVRDWLLLLGVFDSLAFVGGLSMFNVLIEE
ncbi:MAG: heme exporter protein CcmB [Polyangiaceae bacterium]|jgi:heme exporter protein B